jgi:ABC-type taurine transport system substrate-binding protein
MRLLNF